MRKEILIHYVNVNNLSNYELVNYIDLHSKPDIYTESYIIPIEIGDSYIETINTSVLPESEYLSIKQTLTSSHTNLQKTLQEFKNTIN
ncbi:MAG: hypothetical protein RLZZ479_1199 [Bacteroidota bacterium]|jgi:hypothetical protein